MIVAKCDRCGTATGKTYTVLLYQLRETDAEEERNDTRIGSVYPRERRDLCDDCAAHVRDVLHSMNFNGPLPP